MSEQPPSHPDGPRTPDPNDPNANTASGQSAPSGPPPAPSSSQRSPSARTPDELFARIDQLEEFITSLPDKLTESWKQQTGTHNPPADQKPPTGEPAQSARTPTNQQTGKNEPAKRSSLSEWWFGK